ncbi:hypothetical protein [Agaribacter marinus]|nr:hypothetical protein [Agaribacter marinus]
MRVSSHAVKKTLLGICAITSLQACMHKDAVNNEHQQRMQRCEQYVGMAQNDCLKGENVTIEEYKDDFREFKKDLKQKNAEKTAKPVLKPKAVEQEK